tara:strand:+ start:125 stop:508 length:384 start_codon:yes stop_codon:yes gene_type:complete
MAIFAQFTLSSVAASITHLAFFAITALLDRIINSEIANFIGLVVDLTLDFFVQQYVFMKKLEPDFTIIAKYLGSEAITITANQLLFMLYYRTLYNEGQNLTVARVIIGITIYTFLVFPLRKYFIYRK